MNVTFAQVSGWVVRYLLTIRISDILDIAIMAFVLYKIFTLVQSTKAASLVKGLLIFLAALVLSSALHLNGINYIMTRMVNLGLLALIILFQPEIRRVLMQLVNGFYSPENPELFRDIYDSLLNTKSSDRADTYFILKDFRSYAEAHKKIDQAYRNSSWWAKAAILNVGHSGKFTSDRTIEEYVRDIWHLKKITVEV